MFDNYPAGDLRQVVPAGWFLTIKYSPASALLARGVWHVQRHAQNCLRPGGGRGRPVSTWVTVDTMDMSEISVRVLDESEWSLYRDIRLRALAESPGSFTATLA
jgi:hypothetical protein